MAKPLGIILYKGPSKLDGKMIVVIATGIAEKSDNEKTGNMIQTWILRADMPPIEAKQYGHDFSVCGNCKHRDFGSCYVNIAQAPGRVFDAYIRDRYTPVTHSLVELFKGRKVRIGSYGDPAAVPTFVWERICSLADGHTGYTHQWNTLGVDSELKKYCMASCDSEVEYQKAKIKGWRSFRVRFDADQNLLDNEFVCPASKEAGNKTSCEKCRACMGISAHTKKDPVIIVHGLEHKIAKFKWGMKRILGKRKYRKTFDYIPKTAKKIINVNINDIIIGVIT